MTKYLVKLYKCSDYCQKCTQYAVKVTPWK